MGNIKLDRNYRFYKSMKTKYIRSLVFILFLIVFGLKTDVTIKAAVTISDITGKGTATSPYKVSNEEELSCVLTKGANGTKWVYIAVTNNITINTLITIENGNFKIFSLGGNWKLTRSKSQTASVNKDNKYTYCIKAGKSDSNNVSLVFGDPALSTYTITLNGNREYFESAKKTSSGWLYIGAPGSVTLDSNSIVQNIINNNKDSGLGAISVYGELSVKGKIKQCKSQNGGAITAKGGGCINMYEGSQISNCEAVTEGGAIWVTENGTIIMYGGTIQECIAGEEGGAIFISGRNASGIIKKGLITKNTSGGSAGGIFSGYSATIMIGEYTSAGPTISHNIALGSGGGIRCNGGLGDNAGGTSYIYSAIIQENKSGKYGGGISVGEPGKNGLNFITIRKVNIIGNEADIDGGGINLAKGNNSGGSFVEIQNSIVSKNYASRHGGGIAAEANVFLRDTDIDDNHASANGGGICVKENVTVHMYSGIIKKNTCTNYGNGIYLNGILNIGEDIDIQETNDVYLCKDKYINVAKQLNNPKSIVAVITSKETAEGTKLVYAGYDKGTAQKLLYSKGASVDEYIEGKSVSKYFKLKNIGTDQLLRPGANVEGYNDKWILISKKYKVVYLSENIKEVENLPDTQIKFWKEQITFSEAIPTRKGYTFNENKSWNLKSDATSTAYKLGAPNTLNTNLNIYAIWEKNIIERINILSGDRYYVVGQTITIDKSELLKKVKVKDEQNNETSYDVKIIKIEDEVNKKCIFDNLSGLSQNQYTQYFSTKCSGELKVTLYSEIQDSKVNATSYMKIYILPKSNQVSGVRFIRAEYFWTLDNNSRWNTGELKTKLKECLNKGSESEPISVWKVDSISIKNIKKYIQTNKYKMKSELNKSFHEKYAGLKVK